MKSMKKKNLSFVATEEVQFLARKIQIARATARDSKAKGCISSSSLFPCSLLHLVIYSVLPLNHYRGWWKSDVTSWAHRDPRFLQLLFHSMQDAHVWTTGKQGKALCFSSSVQRVGAIYLLLFSHGDTCSSAAVERWESTTRKQSEDFFRSNRDVDTIWASPIITRKWEQI